LSKSKLNSILRDVTDGLVEGFGKLFIKFSTYRDILLYAINLNAHKKLYIRATNRVRNLSNYSCFIVL
jgi:hypothetical protein